MWLFGIVTLSGRASAMDAFRYTVLRVDGGRVLCWLALQLAIWSGTLPCSIEGLAPPLLPLTAQSFLELVLRPAYTHLVLTRENEKRLCRYVALKFALHLGHIAPHGLKDNHGFRDRNAAVASVGGRLARRASAGLDSTGLDTLSDRGSVSWSSPSVPPPIVQGVPCDVAQGVRIADAPRDAPRRPRPPAPASDAGSSAGSSAGSAARQCRQSAPSDASGPRMRRSAGGRADAD